MAWLLLLVAMLSLLRSTVSLTRASQVAIPHRSARLFGGYYSDGGIPRRNVVDSFFYELSSPTTEASRILLVGEGDLGFSAFLSSLQQKQEGATFEIVASTWDTQDRLFNSFDKAQQNVASILDANENNKVLYEVDATQLGSHQDLTEGKFDTIWWNFPHTPGKANIKRNRLLLMDFMTSAKPFLKASISSSIKIALCGNQSGCTPATADTILWNASWKLIDATAEAGLLLTDIEKLDGVLEHEDMKRYYEPIGWRGSLGKFSAYRGDNAHIFTMKDPMNTIESDVKAVKAVQAPLYSHELHLLLPDVTTDIQKLETDVTALAREICTEVGLALRTTGDDKVLASHYGFIVSSVHLVDLYICPSSSQISHAIEISYCSLTYPPIDRNTADLMRIAIQDKLPSHLSDECSLRKEKTGGLVSKAHSWLLTSKLRELRDDGDEDEARYSALSEKLADFHREWAELSELPNSNQEESSSNQDEREVESVEDANGVYEDKLALIQSLARTLWDRRIGVLVNQLYETSDNEDNESVSEVGDTIDGDDIVENSDEGEDSSDNQWVVYLLKNSLDTIKRTYLGVTTLTNQNKRLRQHNGYLVGGAKYTKAFKGHGEWQYAMKIRNLSKSQALSIEKRVKDKSCYSTKDVVERRVGRILDVVKDVVPEGQEVDIEYVEE